MVAWRIRTPKTGIMSSAYLDFLVLGSAAVVSQMLGEDDEVQRDTAHTVVHVA